MVKIFEFVIKEFFVNFKKFLLKCTEKLKNFLKFLIKFLVYN